MVRADYQAFRIAAFTPTHGRRQGAGLCRLSLTPLPHAGLSFHSFGRVVAWGGVVPARGCMTKKSRSPHKVEGRKPRGR